MVNADSQMQVNLKDNGRDHRRTAMKRRRFFNFLLAPVLPRITLALKTDGDWPQWQGPDRTGISTETGLLKTWPASGPPVVWSISNLGEGYGSLAIAGDRIFVQG